MIKIILIWMILPLIFTIYGIVLVIKNYKKETLEGNRKIPFVGIILLIIGVIWSYFASQKLGFL
jgi:hypothetical protein